MLHELKDLRIHIKPGDFIADVDEVADGSEPRSRCRYYIEPYGPFQLNEVCEANYFVGNTVPYHEHTKGYETFLVDGGSLEVMSKSRMAIAKKGDIVHFPAFAPHSIHILEDNTIWRAFHQELQLTQGIIEDRRIRDMYPELYNAPNFKEELRAKSHSSVGFAYAKPECTQVPADQLDLIRPFDFGLANFEIGDAVFRLKVGRWETGGAKEVWQMLLKAGRTLSWGPKNIHPFLFDIYSGSVEVRLDGLDTFTAQARDLLHIPKFVAGSITTLEDTVLLDCGCQGFLTRYMDELRAYSVREPGKQRDKDFIAGLMDKYDYYIAYDWM